MRRRRRVGALVSTFEIFKKDIGHELRGRARLSSVLSFASLTLLLFSFAVGPQHQLQQQLAPGFLWLAILLSSALSLGESMRQETETGALEGLRLLGAPSMSLFMGKALANALFLAGLGMVLWPLAMALYGVDARASFGWTPLILALGALGISAPGTLYAAMTADARAKDLLLPLLLFPILIPGLLASVKATQAAWLGDPLGGLPSWLLLLAAFNCIYWPLCAVLYGKVIEP